ncbi:reverse transcriptase domain, Reverse transcriptase zinc-binding domain protein [Artemisia annua]|uniref:Reverse transcriptase domain, Reverse transcriptase zinc-binding domain protein n=1 Tax=Artemisia annua TaxID=35608 RepID=A0A2U1NVD4_ARTAN|nr:reverse transcriptase domain, Reverse transcriptase zinc-binding domain protein [Artemisia annua]
MVCIESDWKNIVSNMTLMYNGSSIDSIIRRLGLAASVYLIWQERNLRLFKEESRSVEILFEELCEIIRLRMSSLKVKNSEAVLRAQKSWNISLDICEGGAL